MSDNKEEKYWVIKIRKLPKPQRIWVFVKSNWRFIVPSLFIAVYAFIFPDNIEELVVYFEGIFVSFIAVFWYFLLRNAKKDLEAKERRGSS